MLTALVLFFVLFFPPYFQSPSLVGGIRYSLFWRVPALMLVLLLLGKSRKEEAGIYAAFRPGRDLPALGIGFPALCFLAFLVSLAAARSGFPAPPLVPSPDAPSGALAWTGVILASLSIGYLEEAYFRVYLPIQSAVFGKHAGFWFPILLFSLCHVYEGPWGFINAFLAALLLSLVFLKTASFHGIALAHGFYNIAVYLAAGMGNGE